MKILIIFHKIQKKGGVVILLLKIAKQFEQFGHEVSVFSFDSITKSKNIFLNLININRNLKNHITIFNPDVIFTADLFITTIFSLLAKKNQIPIISFVGTLTHSFYASRIIEMISPNNIYVSLYYFINFILEKVSTIIFKKINYTVFNSYLNQKLSGSTNSIVIPNGVEITTNLKLKINQPIKLIYVGRIHPRKTIELIIESLKILKRDNLNFHFSIVGQTSHHPKYWNKLSALIDKYQLVDFITVHNEIENKLLFELLQTHDVLLFSTDDRNYPVCEGLPNVILEGMANGLAIVSTDVGDIAKVVSKKNGFLVKPIPEDFAEKITFLIKNHDILLQMKKENVNIVAQNYTIKKVAILYLKLFEQILSLRKK